ncbi:D-alanyl-D-alanine carboxypeptidase [Streptomyces abikoensis]
MAGESPGKSEQRKSSGETTRGEHDPRLGVFRESSGKPSGKADAPVAADAADAGDAAEGGRKEASAAPAEADAIAKPGAGGKGGTSGGDARLKAAVAAWVAGSDEDEPDDSGESGDSAKASAGESSPNGAPASGDRATSVFRTLKPKADEGAAGDGDAAKPANGSGKGEDGKDAKPAASADQATAVFRAVKPKADEAPAKPANGSGKGEDGKDAKPAAPADQATAVFRAVTPKAGDGDAAKPANGSGKGEDGKDAKPAASADQATAVFRAVKPKADEGAGKPAAKASPSSDDQPTALIKAPEVPEPKKAAPAKAAPAKAAPAKAAPREDSDSERTSQFVPLKSDEPAKKPAPAKPAAKATPPAAKATPPAAKATPPAAKASAPAKPAIPVTVTPPADPAPKSDKQGKPGGGAPAAPLDLLAQLTNTPPPPETPVRTILRRVKIWTPLVVLLAIIFCVVQAFRPLPEPKLVLTAHKSVKFDGDKAQMTWPTSGQAYVEVDGLGSLGEYGEEKPVPIASVTKVMTAYITLRDHPMKKGDKKGALMTVDAKAVSDYQKGKPEGESLVRVTEGQQLSEYEALEALMLPSANNIAKLLARWDSKTEEAFVKKMNDTAKELGMVNTHFTDPSGFDATTKSTAKDLVKLGKKAMADPVFREISGLTEYIDSNGEKQKNFNPIVPLYGTGIKTGTTTAAGGNLLFAAEKKIGGTTQLIIGAVLAQHKTPIIDSVVAATKDAIESAKKALEAKTVVKKGDVVGAVDDGLGGRTPVVATKDVTAVGWAGLTVGLELNDGGHKVPHTAKPGAEVGMLTVGSGPGQVRVPVALKSELAEPGFGAKLTRLG